MILEIVLASSVVAVAGWLGVRKSLKARRDPNFRPTPEPLYRLDVKIAPDAAEPVDVVEATVLDELDEPLTELPQLEGTLEFEREVEEVSAPLAEKAPEIENRLSTPVVEEEPETVAENEEVTEEAAEVPQGILARFSGTPSPKPVQPVDLSDADDAFDLIDHEELESVGDLDPELGERLTALYAKLDSLGGIVSDLEEKLSIFDNDSADEMTEEVEEAAELAA